MPILKLSIKANKQNKKAYIANKGKKQAYKNLLKKLRVIAKSDDQGEKKSYLSKVYSALDKLGKKNIFHKNKVARKKAQACKLVKEEK